MRVEFTKHGIKHDYRGAHILTDLDGRLMTVVGIYRRETPAAIMFKVRHFNGEPAPDVAASAVEVLERTCEGGR